METLFWDDAWSYEDYEWPVVPNPDAAAVEKLGKTVVASGGRAMKEAHADRSVTMEFANAAQPGTRIRKQVNRAECRRRAQIMAPLAPDTEPAADTSPRENADPLKVCVVCDSVHLWPNGVGSLAS
jgi:hypothetical protein